MVWTKLVIASLRASSAPERGSTWDDEDAEVVIAGRYVIEARLGHGASGSVYRVRDRVLERHVALKLLEPGALLGAEHEARVLAAVRHRNVVTIHDLGRDQGRRYLVLELLEGPNLRSWLSQSEPKPEAIIHAFTEAGRGLAAAHEAGLVHRDFKADNVIVAEHERVVVVDFGLAEALAPALDGRPASGLTRGTLAYMAPEQLDGGPADARSDQFSFCVALWEALTGSLPFSGDDPLARHRSILAGPQTAQPGSLRPIRACLERGLSPDPGARFESMDALLEALTQVPTPEPPRPLFRPLVLLAGLALALLIGWGVTGVWRTLGTAEDASLSSFDPRPDAVALLLEDAEHFARAGMPDDALAQLVALRQLADDLGPAHPSSCSAAEGIERVADILHEHGDLDAAGVGYALALRFTRSCPALEPAALLAKRDAARDT